MRPENHQRVDSLPNHRQRQSIIAITKLNFRNKHPHPAPNCLMWNNYTRQTFPTGKKNHHHDHRCKTSRSGKCKTTLFARDNSTEPNPVAPSMLSGLQPQNAGLEPKPQQHCLGLQIPCFDCVFPPEVVAMVVVVQMERPVFTTRFCGAFENWNWGRETKLIIASS